MPKHPLWFLGFPSQPAYRGATHEMVYGKSQVELDAIRTDLKKSLNERYPDKYKLLEHLSEGMGYPEVLYDVLFHESRTMPAVADDVVDPTSAVSTTGGKGDGENMGTSVASVVSEVDKDSMYVNSFQLLWEEDHGRRIRFVQKYNDGKEMVVHIDAYKDVVRIRPDQYEVKEQLWKKHDAFFHPYTEQTFRGCLTCFDLYPPSFRFDFRKDLNPKRVKDVRRKIRSFLQNKLRESPNVFTTFNAQPDLKGKWTSYRTLDITSTEGHKCTIEVGDEKNGFMVDSNNTPKLMGKVKIGGANANFNERVMALFDGVCTRAPGSTVATPKDDKLSAWKTIYDFSRVLNVTPDDDVLELPNLLDMNPNENGMYADIQSSDEPRRGTGTQDVLYSRFDAMITTPTDSLYAQFGDMSKQFDSLHHTTPPPTTYNGGIGPLGNVFAEM